MSFPVPIAYELNDELNNTKVVYNNGWIWEGLPDIPGVRPTNVLKFQEITLTEDHDSTNKIIVNLQPSYNFFILLVCLSPMETPDTEHNLVPWYSWESQGANLGRSGRYLNTLGVLVGPTSSSGTFFEYNRTTNTLSFPYGNAYHMLNGQKYALYQIEIATVNEV